MNQHDHDSDQALQARLQYLLDLDISPELLPEQRLLLAILRQSVVDYFDDDPQQRLDAALYFAHSPLYRTTLSQFGLPEMLLPEGVDLTGFRRKEKMKAAPQLAPLRLETLVRQLSGSQLKVILTMGLLPLPATTRRVGLACHLSRSAAKAALEQLAAQGLVEIDDSGVRALWALGEEMERLLEEVWAVRTTTRTDDTSARPPHRE